MYTFHQFCVLPIEVFDTFMVLPEMFKCYAMFLGVAPAVVIILSVTILLAILIPLHYCEKYRKVKKFSKLLRRLGGLTAVDDEMDYPKNESWDKGQTIENAMKPISEK